MQINRQELVDALVKVKPGLANKEIIEFTTHFIFSDNTIQTYNDQISILQKMETGLIGAISANEFFALVNKLTDEELDIEVEDDKFVIKGRKSTARINIVQQHDLPLISGKFQWSPLPSNFSEAVKFCLFSVSKDMTRPDLTNLNIVKDRVISTDKYRITRRIMNGRVKKDFLLPGSAAIHLVNYNPTKYCLQKEWLHFTNKEETVFSTRVMNVEYPDVEEFMKVEGDRIKFPAGLMSSIDRAEILAKTEFEQDLRISLILKKSVLICKGQGPLGDIEETHRIRYPGPEIKLYIHPVFLKEILDRLKEVTIGERALLFEGDDFQHVVSLAVK